MLRRTNGKPNRGPGMIALGGILLALLLFLTEWKGGDMSGSLRLFGGSREVSCFELSGPQVWGDVGDVLIAGDYSRDKRGQLLLYRTGPFVPPIAIPGMGAMVVTDQFRRELEASPLKGLTFHPVTKHRVVEFHWEHWDRNEHHGDLPPEVDEPEDLVLKLPHSDEASRAIGQLWEARAERLVVVQVTHEWGPGDYEYRMVTSRRAVRGIDFFSNRNQDRMLVSAKAKEWLEEHVPEWVSFKPYY